MKITRKLNSPGLLIGALAVLIVLIAAASAAIIGGLKTANQPNTPSAPYQDGQTVSIEGIFLCLPHKNTSGPQTTECAFGLKDDSGTYYALQDASLDYSNISGQPTNTRVRVKGTFKPRQNPTNYQDSGLIRVTSVDKL
jgi:hypothetical protein